MHQWTLARYTFAMGLAKGSARAPKALGGSPNTVGRAADEPKARYPLLTLAIASPPFAVSLQSKRLLEKYPPSVRAQAKPPAGS